MPAVLAICAFCSIAAAQAGHFIGAQSAAVDESPVTHVPSADRYSNDPDQDEKQTSSGAHFGFVKVGNTSAPISLSFTFESTVRLGRMFVLTQGAKGLDFANARTGNCKSGETYQSGDQCTVDVMFTPRFAGTRYGGVVLEDYGENVIGTGYLQGVGLGAQVNFVPEIESAIVAPFYKPYGIAVDGNGNIYLAEPLKNLVVKETLMADGYSQSTLLSFDSPTAIAVDGAGYLYVAGGGGPGVLKVTLSADKHERSRVGLGGSSGVAVDGSGNVYFSTANAVYKEAPSDGGYIMSTVARNLEFPYGIAADGQGNVYIAEDLDNKVLKETKTSAGYIQSTIGSGLNAAEYVAVDGRGNVFISDLRNSRILEETPGPHGYIQSTVPTGPLYLPLGIAVDASGNLYIAEPYNVGTKILKDDFRDPRA